MPLSNFDSGLVCVRRLISGFHTVCLRSLIALSAVQKLGRAHCVSAINLGRNSRRGTIAIIQCCICNKCWIWVPGKRSCPQGVESPFHGISLCRARNRSPAEVTQSGQLARALHSDGRLRGPCGTRQPPPANHQEMWSSRHVQINSSRGH